jgi:hypothetical protein
MLHSVALVRTDVSEEFSASIIRVTRVGERGTFAVPSNRRPLRRNTIDFVPPKHQFVQEPHGLASQKTPFFMNLGVYLASNSNEYWNMSVAVKRGERVKLAT